VVSFDGADAFTELDGGLEMRGCAQTVQLTAVKGLGSIYWPGSVNSLLVAAPGQSLPGSHWQMTARESTCAVHAYIMYIVPKLEKVELEVMSAKIIRSSRRRGNRASGVCELAEHAKEYYESSGRKLQPAPVHTCCQSHKRPASVSR
jgi:hypothetical protein